MKKLIWGLLFLIFFTTGISFAVEEKTTVRVGISNNSFSTYEHSSASFILAEPSSVVDIRGSEKKELEPNSILDVKISDGNFIIDINGKTEIENAKGPIVITSSGRIGIKDLKRKGTPANYEGMIELKATKPDKFNIINVLSMQSYLKGVVPNEMPISFGYEALRAQAVAARNYANRPNGAYANYDVCDSTACQVYYGANSRTEISDKAVDSTLGLYALYNNEIILALYSSTPGGITENYLDTFGNFIEDKPYLKSVKDSKDLKKLNEEDFFKKAPPSFDMNSPKYRWQKKFTRFELEDILSKTLAEQSKIGAVEPKFTSDCNFYGLEDIKVLKRGESNKVLEIEVKSVSGNYTVKKELPIRRLLKSNGQILPSANFITEKEFDKKAEKEEQETIEDKEEVIFKTEKAEDENKTELLSKLEEGQKRIYRTRTGKRLPSEFIFFGAGFGHGVGMSQYGAGYLSSFGVDFENILKHYYTGINIGTVPKTVSYNNLGLNYTQEFYFTKKREKGKFENLSKSPLKKELTALLNTGKNKRCYLIIENEDKASNIEFFINNYYFNPDIKNFKKKVLKTDITNYLEDGNNKIIFKPLTENDKRKTIKFYIRPGEENE